MSEAEDDFDEPLMNTQEIIADARRPVLIERHREMIAEMEGGISDAFVSGESEHPRFQAMLQELEAPSEQARIASSLERLASDVHYEGKALQDAVIEYCCLLREEQGVEVATLQLHIIGIYRSIRKLFIEQQALIPNLDDLRTLTAGRLGRLLSPLPLEFGVPGLLDSLVVTESQQERILSSIRQLMRAEGGDGDWHEAAGDPPLSRQMEAPLRDLPEEQRPEARAKLVADRVRSRFFRAVFLQYFDRDTLGDEEIAAHCTVLHWLESIMETPHLYPFMQGQTDSQKIWRMGRLLRKVIQINEIYQRIAMASNHPSYRERFEGLNMRDKLSILAKDHYPAMKVDNLFMLNTALCPFKTFAAWVQEHVSSKNFILPPDPRNLPTGLTSRFAQ